MIFSANSPFFLSIIWENLTIESDGLHEFIDFSGIKAQEKLKSEGINIKLEFDDRLKVFIPIAPTQ